MSSRTAKSPRSSKSKSPRESGVVSGEEIRARNAGLADLKSDYEPSLACEIRCFLSGLIFLTRIPAPPWCNLHPEFLIRGMVYFPVLGVIIGLWSAIWFDAGTVFFSPVVAATLSTAMSCWITGCFHEDGLGDTADAFGGGWSLPQILKIMKDSRVGTYGACALGLFLTAKTQLLGQLGTSEWVSGKGAGPALLTAHCVARITAPLLMKTCTYIIDEEDLKGGFYNWFARSSELLTGERLGMAAGVSAVIATLVVGFWKCMACFVVMLVCSLAAAMYGKRVIGGVIGDFLGATVCITELAIYAVLAIEWEDFRLKLFLSGYIATFHPLIMLSTMMIVFNMYSFWVKNQ